MGFDYSQFHYLRERFARGALRVRSVGEIPDPFALTRAEVEPDRPIAFEWDEGHRPLDLIGTTWAVLDLVSARVISTLTEHGFTGWTTYPVEIRSRSGKRIPGYHGLSVTGRYGPIDDMLSPIEVLPPPVPGGAAMPHHIGLLFHPESWDGSDVFTPEGTGHVFVTQPVRDALEQLGVTNMNFEPLNEVSRLVLDED